MINDIFNVSVIINSIGELKFIGNIESGLFDSLISSTILYLKKLQSSFTFYDLQNFMYGITVLRFFFYCFLYDIKTSFSISCISFFAAKIWYSHLIYVLKTYGSAVRYHPIPKNLWVSYLAQEKRNALLRTYKPSKIIATSIKQLFGNNNNSYRIDPISMVFSSLPNNIREYSDRVYYTFWNSIGPSIFRIVRQNAFVSKMAFGYLLAVRLYKKRCPYIIRWHWTFVLLSTILIEVIVPLPFRIEDFAYFVLLPQKRWVDYFLANSLVGAFVLSHITFVLLALFHALLGQYFYIPFITENVEIHIGKRPTNSIYSGGYTAWQDYDIFLNIHLDPKFKKKTFFPRIWWGWFGRGDQPTISKKRKRKRGKLFKNLRKFFKNLFRKFI